MDASTVILVRDAEPWECFMVRRHVRSDFAADVFVFPGGKVDPPDADPETHDYARGGVQLSPSDVTLRVAAIRELFEEAGVLLARSLDGSILRLDAGRRGRLAAYRRDLHAGTITLSEIARVEKIILDVDALVPFSRWITPEPFPRRFDTHFFAASVPPGQEARHDTLETTDSVWIAPGAALRRFAEGAFPLVYATEKHLERMSRFASIRELMDSISTDDLEPIMPRVLQDGSEVRFLIPGDSANETQQSLSE